MYNSLKKFVTLSATSLSTQMLLPARRMAKLRPMTTPRCRNAMRPTRASPRCRVIGDGRQLQRQIRPPGGNIKPLISAKKFATLSTIMHCIQNLSQICPHTSTRSARTLKRAKTRIARLHAAQARTTKRKRKRQRASASKADWQGGVRLSGLLWQAVSTST